MERRIENLKKAVALAERAMTLAITDAEYCLESAIKLDSYDHLAHNLSARCVTIERAAVELSLFRRLLQEAELEETMRAGEELEREEWFNRRTEDELRSIRHDAAMNGAALPHGITISMIWEELERREHEAARNNQLSEEQNERRQLGVSAL